MSIRGDILNSIFGGRNDPLEGAVKQTDDATSPNGVVSSRIGAFLIIDYNGNAADNDVYINTDGASAWSLVYDASAQGHI